MLLRNRKILSFAASLSALGWTSAAHADERRPITVYDIIEAKAFGTPLDEALDVAPAHFSPARDRFVVLTRAGVLAKNTVRYELTLFVINELAHAARPHPLFGMESATVDPAIDQLQWSIDGRRLLFIGTTLQKTRQVFSFDLHSRRLKLLSHSSTDVQRFAATQDERTLVYLASVAAVPNSVASVSKPLVITNQSIPSLLGGGGSDSGVLQHYRLYTETAGHARKISLGDEYARLDNGISISPNGKYATIALLAEQRPEDWSRYHFPTWMRWIVRHELIDIAKGRIEPLLDAPSDAWRPEIGWNATSDSVIIATTYPPLNGAAERLGAPLTEEIAIEVHLPDRKLTLVAPDTFHLRNWTSESNELVLDDEREQSRQFTKTNGAWKEIGKWTDSAALRQQFKIQRESGMQQPDRLVAIERGTSVKRVLYDPNPQFAKLAFGEVREMEWKTSDGHAAKGGLYLPVNYRPGTRYPLVIQTHGWTGKRFWMDGPSTAGYAAQALAGRGFVVAQVNSITGARGWQSTPQEGPFLMAMVDSLIDDLDSKGMIDSTRVGILGWSRSAYLTRYTLEFSKHSFGAAVIADGYDDGYFHYLTRLTLGSSEGSEYEHMLGALPFSPGLKDWEQRSTGFNLDRVHTPVRLLGFSATSLLSNWEWFAGLTHLQKPVEFVWMPEAGHVPVLPKDRMIAQEGDVDWFCFWLKGEEDSPRQKSEEFLRWEELRNRLGYRSGK